MAKGFNLTAEINLRGPSNIRQVVGNIRKQLTGINADVNVKLSSQTIKQINTANKSFQNFNKTLKQTQSLAAATASAFSQLSNASSKLSGSLGNVPSAINSASQATQSLSQNSVKTVGTVRQLSSEFSEFGKQSALAVRRFAAFATVTGIIYKVSNAINQATSDFVSFERELVKVAQVSGTSVQNLNFLVQNVTRLSTTLGVASEDLIGVSRTLTQAGLSARETSTALEALAKSALAPTFDDLNRTVEGSVALMKQFRISAAQLEGALGSINAVAGRFAVEAGDIITAISRTGGVFASASKGVSQGTDALNEFIAVFTSIRATTRESAETIATGLRTIFTRIQRKDTIDALKAYGVELTDLEGKFVGPYQAVQLLAAGLGKLDPRDLKFSQIVEELGGFRQIGKVIPLIQQFATAQDALRVAQQGQGSLARDAATAQQSLAVQLTRVREEFTALVRSIGQSQSLQNIISLGLDLASVFIRVADAAKGALPAITALFAVKGLKALGQFGSGFLGGIKKSQGFNDGGYVHHFARGGIVPGSGNRDTVPAMLQPGEFVIKKSSAKAIGARKLHAINKYADGGPVRRRVGYIDYDVIANPANEAVVAKGMEQTGVKGTRLYADYLTNLATRARKDSSIGKLSAIYGVAGSGKTTLARGQGTDKGTLRDTDRFPILTPQDIQKSTEVIVLSSSVSKKKLDEVFSKADRTYTLSSTTEAEKSRIASQRASRDTTGVGLEGRKPGTTTKVESDTAIGEAVLSDKLGSRSVVLGRTESGKLRRKNKDELVQVIKKKIGFTWGGFSPMTAGHESIMDAAAAAGIPAQDFIYLVGSNEGITNSNPSSYRTAIFDQDARVLLAKAGAGAKGATVLPKDKGFEVPQAFDVGTQSGRRQVVVPAKGSTVFVADKDEKSLSKYRESGYDVKNLERTGGISGTQVRDLIMSGNMGQLQQVLSPNVYELISNNIKQIRNRANVLPEIIEEVKKRETTSLAEVESQIKSLGISRIDNKKVESDPEYAAQVDVLKELRKKRDKIKSFASFEPYSILAKMAAVEPEQYGLDFSMPTSAKPMRQMGKKTQKANLGGQIQKFARGGVVPGTGNRDTVPAMLTPGEFVIRKKAVETIGVGNLVKMNKYASGGIVQRFDMGGEVKAGMVISEILNNKKGTVQVSARDVALSTPQVAPLVSGSIAKLYEKPQGDQIRIGSASLLEPKDIDSIIASTVFGGSKNKTYNTEVAGVGNEQNEVFNRAIQKYTKEAIENSAKVWGRSANVSVSNVEFAEDFSIPGGQIGSMFEQMIQGLAGEPIASAASEDKRPFDFTSGLGRLVKRGDTGLFDIDDQINYVDAKKSIGSTGASEFKKKIANQLVIDEFLNIQSAIQQRINAPSERETAETSRGNTGPARAIPEDLKQGQYGAKDLAGRLGVKTSELFRLGFSKVGSKYVWEEGGRRLATGGSVEDTVPALLTPGEFVINKKAASRIGSARLNKMNKADRIKGYNKGGWVGFATGGGVEARGTELGTIGINPQDVAGLQELVKTINELGITGSSTAKLLESGNQASYQSTLDVLEADRLHAVAIGQSTDAIDTQIAALKQQSQQALKTSEVLSGVRGENLQGLQRRLSEGQDLTTAAKKEKLPELEALAKAGEIDTTSVQAYIAQASRDRQTLAQMDKRFVADRTSHYRNLGKSAQEASKLAKQEAAARKKIVDQFARTQGAKGPGDFGKRISEFSNKIGIGVSLFTSTLSSVLGEATTATQAGLNAGLQGAGATFGAAQIASGAAVDLLPDELKGKGGVWGLVISGALAAGQAFISASNAAREFKINEQFKKAETASDQVAEAFAKLEKDVNGIDVQTAIEDKLVQAGDALSRGLAIQQNEAKLFWANAIDVISSGGGRTGQEAAQRSQIYETEGFVAYLRSFDANFRESRIAATRPERSQASAAQFRPVADNINKLFEERLGKGESVNDILKDVDFASFANSLARADQATNQRIQAILDDTSLTQQSKDAKIKNISAIYAEEQVRRQAAVIARQKEIDALQASTSRYTQSLQRMYTNMEQSINAAVASLNRMNSQIDTTISSLQGQAKIGDVILDAITVLQNPRAFGSAQVQSSTGSAAGIFGSEAANMAGLINLGENIEASVFGSINRTLEQAAAAGESASNARVLRNIDLGVQDTLDNLGLPPELADKLANEVKAALKDITKDAKGDFDFAQISEKIAGLGSVIESSARAREVAIKALEAYNTALNSYTQNLNKVIDIEISSRNYARKSLDILSNSALDLSKALGESVSVNDIVNKRNREIGRQTGGPTSPQDVFDQIQKLERDRVSQQATVDATAQTGLGGTDQFVDFNNKLKDTSIGLRENIAALKSMADNTEVASAALNKIQEAQQRNASKVGFLEKAVTSTPEELESMNRAFGRLQNNINGQINTINNSIGAQKAYYEALQNGANQFQAMRAAQGAFAQERGESLSLLKDILPFLGDQEETGAIRANVLESMLRESGIGVNPLIQQVLNSLRNPQADPAVAAAIQQYKQANALQSKANELLGRLDAQLAADISAKNEQSFRNALNNVTLQFENQKLDDIAKGIGQVVQNTAPKPNNQPGAPAFAQGGIIYAQTGQQIFQPKGTDTVPAMLTPGEFVVNRKATQANLPLLKSINSGYYAAGGLVTGWNGFKPIKATQKITQDDDYVDLDSVKESMKRYHLVPDVRTVITQDQNSYPASIQNLNRPPSIYPSLSTEGNVYFGIAAGIKQGKRKGGRNAVKESHSYVDYSKKLESIQNDSDKYYIGQQILDSSAFNQTAIAEEDLEDYRKKLSEKRDTMGSILDPVVFKGYLQKTVKNPRSLSAARNGDSYNPNNIKPDKYIGLAENANYMNPEAKPVSPSTPGYKIWQTPVLDASRRYRFDTISGKNTLAFNAPDPRANGRIRHTDDSSAKTLKLELPNIGYEQTSKLVDLHTDNYRLWSKSIKLLNNDPVFKDERSDTKLLDKLSNLYNNNSAYELFTGNDLSLLTRKDSFSPGDNINSLIVASQGPLETALFDKAQETIDLLNDNQNPLHKGIFGHNSFPNTSRTIDAPFDIGTDIGENTKDFAWAANISIRELGEEFKQAQEQELRDRQQKQGPNTLKDLGPEKLKTTLKAKLGDGSKTDVPFEFGVHYKQYIGKLFDTTQQAYSNNGIEAFLPFKVEDPFHLFKNVITDGAKLIGLENKIAENDINFGGNFPIQGLTSELLGKYYESISNNTPDGDQNLKNQILGSSLSLGPLLLQLLRANSPMPVFTQKFNDKQSVNIGEALVANIKKAAIAAGAAGEKIATPDDALTAKGEQLDDNLFAEVTKKLTLGGLQLFSSRPFSNSRQFLGRNLGRIPRNDNIDTKEEAQQVAGFVSNIFQVVGGEASRLFNFARNPRYAQFLKENFILSSGASQAFSGISQGVTAIINDFFKYAEGDFPLAAVEGLFRSLGGGQALEQAKNLKLPGGYADIFNNQLQGTKIAEIGPNGSIVYKPMTDAVPEDVRGLIDLIFNPYNAFPNTKARTNLIDKFQNDLNNLKGGGGLPYFDANTYNFINRGIDTLEQWYGGAEGWSGQDFIFDRQADPDDNARAQKLAGEFANIAELYQEAQAVNAAFGIKNKYGNLPDKTWFLARARAGADPQTLATGGIVYARTGGQMVNFQPQGTDTVPAMLTPGEFVVNRAATQKNLPLLKAINDGQSTGPSLGFNKGGVVYAAGGVLLKKTTDIIGAGGLFASAGYAGLNTGTAGDVIGTSVDFARSAYAGGATAGAASYGATVLATGAMQAAEYARDFEGEKQKIYERNRKQAGQNVGRNLVENLSNPGRAGAQLIQESAGGIGDISEAMSASEKTRRMIEDRRQRKGAERVKNRLMKGSIFDPEYYVAGGVVYAADGMMIGASSSFTTKHGKTIEAKLLEVGDSYVKLLYKNREYDFPFNQLDADTVNRINFYKNDRYDRNRRNKVIEDSLESGIIRSSSETIVSDMNTPQDIKINNPLDGLSFKQKIAADSLKFTDTEGSTVSAKLLNIDGGGRYGTIEISRNRRRYTVPFDKLNQETRERIATYMLGGQPDTNETTEWLNDEEALQKYGRPSFMQRDIGDPSRWSPYDRTIHAIRKLRGLPTYYKDPDFDPNGVGAESRGNYLPYSTEMRRPAYRKITDLKGNTITGYVVKSTDKEAIIQKNDGSIVSYPLNQLSSADRNMALESQSWSDRMSETGDLGFASRPAGTGMLKVPKGFEDLASARFTDVTTGNTIAGRIVEVGPDGVMMQALSGANTGNTGFVSYDRLDSAGRGRAYELYQSAQRTQQRQGIVQRSQLEQRVARLLPGGYTRETLAAVNPNMTDREIRETARKVEATAAARRQQQIEQREEERRQRQQEVGLDILKQRMGLTPDNPDNFDPDIKPEPNRVAVDVKQGQLYKKQFASTGLPEEKFGEWLSQNYPNMSSARYNAIMASQQVGTELSKQFNAIRRTKLDPTPGLNLGETGARKKKEIEDRRNAAEDQQQAKRRKLYEGFKERYDKKKAIEIMEKRGYIVDPPTERIMIKRQDPAAAGQGKPASDPMIDRYWKEYNQSGTKLDPLTWAKRNLPGLKDARLEAFVAKSGMTMDEARAKATPVQQYTTVGGDTRERITQTTGLGEEPGTYQAMDKESFVESIMKKEGVTRWQAGNIFDQRQAKAIKQYKDVLPGYMARLKADLVAYTQENAVHLATSEGFSANAVELPSFSGPLTTDELMGSYEQLAEKVQRKVQLLFPSRKDGDYRGLLDNTNKRTNPSIAFKEVFPDGLAYLPRDMYSGYQSQTSGLGQLIKQTAFETLEKYQRQKDLGDIESKTEIVRGKLLMGEAVMMGAYQRQIAAAERVNEELQISDSVEEARRKRKLAVRLNKGGMVYANQGMLIPYQPKGTDTVPAMLTPGEFVVNRAATQANLPLLKAINNGAQGYSNGGIAYRSKGGPIQYFSNGTTDGPVQVISTQFTNSLESATRALTNFGAIVEKLKTAFNQNNTVSNSQNQQNRGGGVNIDMQGISQFTNKIQNLILQLKNLTQIPSEIKLVGTHRVDVNILGAEAFQNLDPAIADLISGEVQNAIAQYNQQTFYV